VILSVEFAGANQLNRAAIILSALLSAMMTMTTKKHHHKHRHVVFFSRSGQSLDGVLDMVRACDDMHDADDVIA
jgi:hypothetical protein